MRDIEFRGKRKDNGELVFGSLIIREEESPVPETTEIYKQYFILVGGFNAAEYEVIPETVGQYTGLLDKDGVKIFEGDIIQDKADGGDSGQVYWHKEHASFYWGHGWTLIHNVEMVVVGNIHDNPELLHAN